jgi:hypothetical protein
MSKTGLLKKTQNKRKRKDWKIINNKLKAL